MSMKDSENDSAHKRQSDDSHTTSSESPKDTAESADKGIQSAPWRALFAFTTRSNIPLLITSVLVSIISAAASPAQNYIIGQLYEGFESYSTGQLAKKDFMRQETKYVLYQVAVAGGSWLFHSLEFMFWMAFGELQAKSARDRLFRGLLDKEIEWYDKRKNDIGALLPRIQAQIRELQLATAQPLGAAVSLTATAVLSLIQAFVRSWDLTLVTLSTVPLIVFIVALCERPMQRSLNKQQDKLTEAQKYTTSAFGAIETVKCFNGQEVELEKYKISIDEAAGWYAWVANANALQMGFLSFLSVSLFVQGFYYGAVVVAKGKITSGDVVTTFFSAVAAFQAIAAILPQMIVFEKGKVASSTLRRIMAQIEGESSVQRTKGLLSPPVCHGDIDIENLSFTYPARPDQLAIKNVSLYITGGELAFLIGKSGSGKSTISQLLMRFYASSQGTIKVDGVSLESLDVNWLRSNITLVEQTSLLFNDTIFRNIALGRKDYENVTREEAMEAAEFALLQLMITDMPNGLDTDVGFKGGSLSGGQRQRMALARARLRDTPILILDESTSALDHISRTLMMEAIRRWRTGKTTIIITHDISQILRDDYVYVLENGQLVQEGYRKHLETMKHTPFQVFLSEEQKARLMISHNRDTIAGSEWSKNDDALDWPTTTSSTDGSPRQSNFDPLERQLELTERRESKRSSFFPNVIREGSPFVGMRSYGKNGFLRVSYTLPKELETTLSTVTSPVDMSSLPIAADDSPVAVKRYTQVLKDLMSQTGTFAAEARQRPAGTSRQRRSAGDSMAIPLTGRDESLAALEANQHERSQKLNSLKYIFSTIWPNLNSAARGYLVLGFWGATVHAAAVPAFSYAQSKLLVTLSVPGGDKPKALQWSMVILAIAIADGIHAWIYRFFHEYTSQLWIDRIRGQAFERVLDQDKLFFEKEENGVSRLTESLDRNAEEMRNLLGRFASLAYCGFMMISISLIWALVAQWKMTLLCLAVAPYVYAVTKAFAMVSEKWEGHSNDAAEEAGAIFTETFTNIKTVRALTLEDHFTRKFFEATNKTLRIGFQRSFYAGLFYGLSDSAGNFSAAMIFYVGLRLILSGINLSDIIQVLTMLIFTIGNVSNILEFIPQIGSSKDTAGRLMRLATLPKDSHEHLGDARITTVGDIVLDNLRFAYPSRPQQTILRNINLRFQPGTTTAIVGGSGSGKSTIANLLLDLYNTAQMPSGGRVGELTFGGRDIRHISTSSLRTHIVPVSQTPTLFAATIAENIAYGLPATSSPERQEAIETAARQAGIHDFIASLPLAYATSVGEGGSSLSGGQAQRLAIARALIRKPAVLILDEATSALDVESANLVRSMLKELISGNGRRMTIVIITHNRDMMEMAGRVVVLDQGSVVEEGRFGELMGRRRGALVNLLSGGEWDGREGVDRDEEVERTAAVVREKRDSVPIPKDVDCSSVRRKGSVRAGVGGGEGELKRLPPSAHGGEGAQQER